MAAVVINNISIITVGFTVTSKSLLFFFIDFHVLLLYYYLMNLFLYFKKIITKNRYCIFYLSVTNYFKHQLLGVTIVFENFIGVVKLR